MPAPRVTFIVATYRRPDALRCTLATLVMQTHPHWDALVIGDRCGPETEAAIRSVRDPRIAYYNLPSRFGEQSGPNSAGLRLATGDFVGFLNQDDLLLKDHLARALERLEARRGDLYFGRFANATRLEPTAAGLGVPGGASLPDGGRVSEVAPVPAGPRVPVCAAILPARDDLRELMTPDHNAFDPSSFWVVRRSFAEAVGPWRPAVSLRRTPLCDWLLRAWRLGGAFCFGDTVTGIRVWTHNVRRGLPADAPTYFDATPENELLVERLRSEDPDDTRAFIERQVRDARQLRNARPGRPSSADASWPRRAARAFRHGRRRIVREARLRLFSSLYLRWGIDPIGVTAFLSGRPKGMVLHGVTRKRIGEGLPAEPSIAEFLSAPEAHRVL